MKEAVVNNTGPFVRSGAEILAETLNDRLVTAGHDVDHVRLPFAWEPAERIADAMLAATLTRIVGVDRVIALTFPAYLVPHDNKVLWILNQYRQFYDLWNADQPHDPTLEAIRELVLRADDDCMGGARRLFVSSEVSASRLRRFNGFHADVLCPPPPSADLFSPVHLGDYIFAGGRINEFQRQLLAVQA